MQPKTLYADSAGAKIAYQMVGRGPDLVMVPGLVTHLELLWRMPAYRRFVLSLASFCRLVRFDKRGTGLSDPVVALPTLQERVADLGAVLRSARCRRPVLLGYSGGVPSSLLAQASNSGLGGTDADLTTERARYQRARDDANADVYEADLELSRLDCSVAELLALFGRVTEAEAVADSSYPPLARFGNAAAASGACTAAWAGREGALRGGPQPNVRFVFGLARSLRPAIASPTPRRLQRSRDDR